MPQIRSRNGHSYNTGVDGHPGMLDLRISGQRYVALHRPAGENDALPGELNGNILGSGHVLHRSKVRIHIERAIGLRHFNQGALLHGARGTGRAVSPLLKPLVGDIQPHSINLTAGRLLHADSNHVMVRYRDILVVPYGIPSG